MSDDNEFMGYPRENGAVGIRNDVAIVPSVECAQTVCDRIASKLNKAIAFKNTGGCAQLGLDFQFTANTLSGLAENPNIHSALVIGLGCENMTSALIRKKIEKSNKHVESFDIQDVDGGTPKAIEKGISIAGKLIAEASEVKKEPFDYSHLVLGLECGGSDSISGISANPAVGIVTDKIIELGGSAILPEFTEWVGTEHLLAKRAKNDDVSKMILDAVTGFLEDFESRGIDFRTTQPTMGNKEGGLSTIEEKSLGTIAKAGKSPIEGLFLYSEKVPGKGLWLMFEPGWDIKSMTGLAAAGAQVIIMTTGRGSPVGNIVCPVIKICGNPETSKSMGINLDVDASKVISGEQNIDQLAGDIWAKLKKVCNGELTRSEEFGFREMNIWQVPDLGPNVFKKLEDYVNK
ncbi:MAG: UxaA family hydrolase [Candidatus Hodarchaeota archaeon]